MSNVLSLAAAREARKKPAVEIPVITADQEVVNQSQNFIEMFYDWAMDNGIDTSETYFKYDAAAIMTIVQGTLQKAGQ